MNQEIYFLWISKEYWEIIYFFAQTIIVLIILIGSIIAYSQLKRTKESMQIQNTFRFYEIFRSKEFQSDLEKIRRLKSPDPSIPENVEIWLERQNIENESFKSVMSFFEQLGSQLKEGYLSKGLVKETYMNVAIDIWIKYTQHKVPIEIYKNFKYLIDEFNKGIGKGIGGQS